MTPETVSLFANACWKPANLPALADFIRAHLGQHLLGHRTWRTKDLFESLGVPLEHSRKVTQALYKLRASGLVDDCFRRDPTKRHMGKEIIIWQAPLSAVRPDVALPETAAPDNVPVVSEEDF